MSGDYSLEFDRLRQNRVEVSAHKYGPARKNFGEGRVDALKTAELCLDAFKKDGNTEHLVDAANYLMFRFMYPPCRGRSSGLLAAVKASEPLGRPSTWSDNLQRNSSRRKA